MQEDQRLIDELRRLRVQKQSKQFYANKLGVSVEKLNELLIKMKLNEIQNSPAKRSSAKILLLDIETSPCLAYVWQTQVWKARIGHKQLVSNWYILTWSAKWLDGEEIFSERLTSFEALDEDDERIMTSLWFLLDEADIVIVHNGNIFDIPNINTRFVIHSLPPPSSYKQIDTLKHAQQQFGFTHNALDALAELFGIEGKIETTFELWKNCLKGSEEALQEMEAYNRNDVIVLEKVYRFLRPYMMGHPNLDLYDDDIDGSPLCTKCGKETLAIMPGKYFYTQAVRYPLYRCTECGGLSRAKKGEPYVNKKVVMAIPR